MIMSIQLMITLSNNFHGHEEKKNDETFFGLTWAMEKLSLDTNDCKTKLNGFHTGLTST